MKASSDAAARANLPDPEYGPVFGLLTPQANTTVEPEMQLLLRGTLLTARCISASADSRQRLLDYLDNLRATLVQFDSAPLRVAGFACTGSAYLVGRAREDEQLAVLGRQLAFPVISATQAIRRCLDQIGARRIALLSPYPAWLSSAAQDYWRGAGYTITAVAGLSEDLADTRGIYGLHTSRVQRMLATLDTRDCDALLLSGTGMPTLRSIAALPDTRPVLSSNLCLAWAMQQTVSTHACGAHSLRAFIGPDAVWRQRLRDLQEHAA